LNPLQQLRDIDYVPGRFLVNLYLNSLYCFISVGFPPNILQAIQSAKDSFVQRFCVNFDAVFGIVAVLQTDNALADRHDELGSGNLYGRRIGNSGYFLSFHKSMNSLTVAQWKPPFF